VISALNGVVGALNGAAIAVPLRARFTVLTTVDTVAGNARARLSGRDRNLTRPPAAMSSWVASPGPATGSGGGESGSVLHSCVSRFVALTPSTAAWCTLIIRATGPPSCGSVPPTPSITHISHIGLLRSSCADTRRPQTSASSLRPPGDGRAIRRR
jgi:hypothetical protein